MRQYQSRNPIGNPLLAAVLDLNQLIGIASGECSSDSGTA
jgi:hypothetical protein